MLQKRVIPCLSLKGRGLVKTHKFDSPKYVGDPINAVKIFNDKEVDELFFLDITATQESRGPSFEVLTEIASECFMPICYGGGVRSFSEIEKIFSLGIEKVSLNSVLADRPELLTEAAKVYGVQALVASVDIKKNFWGSVQVVTQSGTRVVSKDPVSYVKSLVDRGAGEVLLQSVDRDGSFSGYDLEWIEKVSKAVSVPVVALGGARGLEDFRNALEAGASAVAAGSFFVFHGPHKAVLISYPAPEDLRSLSRSQ